jgi:hypothetical protein
MCGCWSVTASRAYPKPGDRPASTIAHTRVVHLLRSPFGYAARQEGDEVAGVLRPVHPAPGEDTATERFLEFQGSWGQTCPAIVMLWSDARADFVPFLLFDVGIRKVICSTNAIESVNVRIRRAVPTWRASAAFLTGPGPACRRLGTGNTPTRRHGQISLVAQLLNDSVPQRTGRGGPWPYEHSGGGRPCACTSPRRESACPAPGAPVP